MTETSSTPDTPAGPAAAPADTTTTAPADTSVASPASSSSTDETAASARAAPPVATAPPGLAKGDRVVYSWEDPYDGPSFQYGVVWDTEGDNARVAWLEVSGNIPLDQLTAAADFTPPGAE